MMTRKLKYSLAVVMSVIAIVCAVMGFTFRPTNVSADSATQVVSVFEMQDKAAARIVDRGMRWQVKMDADTYANVTTKDNVSFHFVIAPTELMDVAEGDYMGMAKKVQIDVTDFSKFDLVDGFYYATGAINNVYDANIDLEFSAVAAIGTTIDGVTTYEYATADNSRTLYQVINSAIVDPEVDAIDTARIFETYDFLGTADYPIAITTSEEDAKVLGTKMSEGVDFTGKYFAQVYPETIKLFTANDTDNYADVSEYNIFSGADNTTTTDAEIAYIDADGYVVAGTKAGTATVTASGSMNGMNIIMAAEVVVVATPTVVISGVADFTISNRTAKGNADATIFSSYAEIRPSVTVDGNAVSAPEFTWNFKEDEDCISVYNNWTFLSVLGAIKPGVAVLEIGWTDSYGVKTTKEINITCDPAIYYGQHERYAFDGVLANVESTNALVIENVDLTTTSESQLIRFQHIPYVEYTWPDGWNGSGNAASFPNNGPQTMFVTIQDAADASNYITFGMRRSWDNWGDPMNSCYVGARASTWSDNSTYVVGNSTTTDFASCTDGGALKTMGWGGGYTMSTKFSMYGRYLDDRWANADDLYTENQAKYMIGLSVVGTEIYVHNNGAITKLIDLSEDMIANDRSNEAWNGFTSDKVNIYIFSDNSGGTGWQTVYVDILGGQALTAQSDLSNFVFGRNFTSLVADPIFK